MDSLLPPDILFKNVILFLPSIYSGSVNQNFSIYGEEKRTCHKLLEVEIHCEGGKGGGVKSMEGKSQFFQALCTTEQ